MELERDPLQEPGKIFAEQRTQAMIRMYESLAAIRLAAELGLQASDDEDGEISPEDKSLGYIRCEESLAVIRNEAESAGRSFVRILASMIPAAET